ncbi:MAG: hypothetical protein ACOH2H_11125 [Cypionkella sp.]
MAKTDEYLKELKEMLAFAKKGPVNIGVCFGKKPEGAEVKLHKKRDPSMLGRLAKSDGETSKVAIGTFSVEGKSAIFNCTEAPPTGLGKHLKKFFKSVDMAFTSVTVIDPEGKSLPEDGDDEAGEEPATDTSTGAGAESSGSAAAETPDPARAAWEAAWSTAEAKVAQAIAKGDELAAKVTKLRDFILGKVNATEFEAALKALPSLTGLLAPAPPRRPGTPEATETTTPTDPAVKSVDPKDLVRRLGAVKPQFAGLPDAIGLKLNEMYQSTIALMKAGDLTKAALTVGHIETALARVAEKPKETPKETAASQTQASASTAPNPDPKFAGLSKAVEALRAQVVAKTAGDAHDAMITVLDTVEEEIGKSEAEKAMAGLKRVQDGLKLQAEVDRLAPMVATAASSGMVADVNALNNLFNYVAGSVPASDHATAMASLARVEEMIAAGATMDKSAQAAEIPAEVKPLATARLNWISTRKTLHDELSKLEAAIAKALDTAGMSGEVEVGGALIKYIDKLDARLEAKLDAIVNAPADGRDKLKTEARGLIAEYQSVLEGDFFKDVDASNGFISVAVTSTAQAMLDDISSVLA